MPSIACLTNLALVLAALAGPVLAAETNLLTAQKLDFTDSLFARKQLERRRPNHANAYGYPHNQGPHKGSGKMTPGGYKDPNPPNVGASCKRDSQCHTDVHLGAATCHRGKCGFRCLGDTVKQGGNCIGSFAAPSCRRSSVCPKTKVAHAHSVCTYARKCTFACNSGYHARGNKCVANDKTCSQVQCAPIEDGASVCQNGVCTYECATYLGYTLFANADKTAYRCVNLASDPDNCGSLGNVCPAGYNGKGLPQCVGGTCSLNCSGYAHKYMLNSAPYCTDQ